MQVLERFAAPSPHAQRATPPLLSCVPHARCPGKCRDSDEFPEVLRWRREVTDTQASLGALLRQFRQTVQISTLEYKSLQVRWRGGGRYREAVGQGWGVVL